MQPAKHFLLLILQWHTLSDARFLSPINAAALPESIDWRLKGVVTPVRTQWTYDSWMCSSCYAIATVGALEGQVAKATGKLVELSPQNILDCSQDWGNEGCDGGSVQMSYEYIKDNDGIDTELSYPYTAKWYQKCAFNKSNVGGRIKGYVQLEEGDEQALQVAVATIGPIAASIDGRHESFRLYKNGVYSEPRCSSHPDKINHAILIVGYGTDERQGPYWLAKNDYGLGWGEDGYFRISRNKNNHCGIATLASYPLI